MHSNDDDYSRIKNISLCGSSCRHRACTLLWKHNKINSNSIRLFKRTIARKSYWIQFRADFFLSFSHSHVQYLLFFCLSMRFSRFIFELERKCYYHQRIKIIERTRKKMNTYKEITKKKMCVDTLPLHGNKANCAVWCVHFERWKYDCLQ